MGYRAICHEKVALECASKCTPGLNESAAIKATGGFWLQWALPFESINTGRFEKIVQPGKSKPGSWDKLSAPSIIMFENRSFSWRIGFA